MVERSGPFTRAQARAAGFSEAAIRRFVRGGCWVPLRHGVFVHESQWAAVHGDPQRRHALDVSAVLLTVGVPAVAAATSAARILGIELLGSPADVVVATASPIKGRRRNGYVLRAAALPGHHCTEHYGVPLTTPARTVLDLARQLPFIDGVVAVDSALRQRLVSVAELEAVLGECWSWAGIARARQVVRFADPQAESVLESVSRAGMYLQGLPMPRTQVTLYDESGLRYRVDFLWDEFRLIGEADGMAKYEPTDSRSVREIVQAEKRREEWLSDAGYEVVRWGWDDARDPERLARRLTAAFARGAERTRGRRHKLAS